MVVLRLVLCQVLCYKWCMVDGVDRALALAWWIAAIIVVPISIPGFFVGGWLLLGALAAWWLNMDVHNPFKRSTSSAAVERQSDVRDHREMDPEEHRPSHLD